MAAVRTVRHYPILERPPVSDGAPPPREATFGRLGDALRVHLAAADPAREAGCHSTRRHPHGARDSLERLPVAAEKSGVGDVVLVSVKQLVRSLSDLDDDCVVVAGELGDEIERHAYPVG